MSFLYPWFWAGMLTAALPLWLHLRAKTGPIFLFPTLQFLEDAPRPRARGFRLRDGLLLLARLLALWLLVAGFAWPFFDRDAGRIVESRVHVIDATLSRQVGGGFARDRERVRQALLAAGPETQDAVVELTDRPRVIVSFSEDRREAAPHVAALTPSFARGSYLDALRLAQSLLAQSLGSRRRILVYADHQENQWTENEATPPFLDGVAVELMSRPEVLFRPNAALAEPIVHRGFIGERAYVDLSADLAYQGTFPHAAVRLRANGKDVLSEAHPLAGTGTMTLRAQWESDPGEWVRGELAVEGVDDALPADDRVYFASPPVREGRVALLSRSPYLEAALSPETMKGRWRTERLDAAASGMADVAEEMLPDVLVIDSDYAQSEQVRALAWRCLNNGRGVLLFVRRATPLVKGFLSELGVTAAEKEADATDTFRSVAAEHPLFKPFLNGELGDIVAPQVFGHVGLTGTSATPLLFGASGDALLLEGTSTRGRLLIFAFALERAQTDWPLLPSFIPFLDLALQHARQTTASQSTLLPGAPLTYEVPREHARPRQVVLSDGVHDLERAAVDDDRHARLEAPGRPGLYELRYDDNPQLEALVAVNPPPKESVLRYLEAPAALKAWTLAAPSQEAVARPAGSRTGPLGARDQRAWWWCLGAALLLLVLESALVFTSPRRPG